MDRSIKRRVEDLLDGEDSNPRRRAGACSCGSGDAETCPGSTNCPFSVHFNKEPVLRSKEWRRVPDGT